MNHKFLSLFFALFFCFSTPAFSATLNGSLSMGRSGEPYLKNGISWQGVKIQTDKFKISASFPGEPSSLLSPPKLKLESIHQNVYYWIETQSVLAENPPKNYNAFVKAMNISSGELHLVKQKKNHVLYIVDYTYINKDNFTGLTRIFVTKNKIYIFGVLGNDFSLADSFFNSFKIDKE